MATPKQTENEDRFLKPALGELQPYYADLFDYIMRGKKRGDGLMIDPDREEEIESDLQELKSMRDEIERQVTKEIMDERYGEPVEYKHQSDAYDKLDLDESRELREDIKEEVNERFHSRLSEDDMMLFEAFYVMNTIKSDDRGSMNIKARFMTTTMKEPVMMDKRSNELRAVAEVFEQYRQSTEEPNVEADKDVLSVTANIYGKGMADRMREKKQKQQDFIEQEVVV